MHSRLRLPRWLRRAYAAHLARPSSAESEVTQRGVCIYKVDRIGDFVLATGALRLLFGHFGAANCRLLVSREAEELAAAEFPDVDRWVAPATASGVWREMRPLRRRLAREWAREQFDLLICLRHQRSLYRDLHLSWLQARRWHGLGARPSAANVCLADVPELSAAYPASAPTPWCRELRAHQGLLESVLQRPVTWEELRPRLHSTSATPGGAIAFCPFGNDRIRDYPFASWVTVLRGAIPPGTSVQVLGPAARRSELEGLAVELRTLGACPSVASDLDAAAFRQTLAAARLILTVENAAAHIATALDKPAVVIVGGGHYGWFAPWGSRERQRWIHHALDCYGCSWQCRHSRVECLEDLAPTAIIRAIQEVMPHE